MKRRLFIKGTLVGSSIAAAASLGLIAPGRLLAEWPKKAFNGDSVATAMTELLGTSEAETSDLIEFQYDGKPTPDVAENGSVVPINVTVKMDKVESITILADKNKPPLVAHYTLSDAADARIGTRIKMRETSDVVAVVKADGKLYQAKKAVEVTAGGCGG